jgi:hypothetical protein
MARKLSLSCAQVRMLNEVSRPTYRQPEWTPGRNMHNAWRTLGSLVRLGLVRRTLWNTYELTAEGRSALDALNAPPKEEK